MTFASQFKALSHFSASYLALLDGITPIASIREESPTSYTPPRLPFLSMRRVIFSKLLALPLALTGVGTKLQAYPSSYQCYDSRTSSCPIVNRLDRYSGSGFSIATMGTHRDNCVRTTCFASGFRYMRP
jgi:hypothetical protein